MRWSFIPVYKVDHLEFSQLLSYLQQKNFKAFEINCRQQHQTSISISFSQSRMAAKRDTGGRDKQSVYAHLINISLILPPFILVIP